MHKRNISKLSLGRIGRTNLLGVGSILALAVLSLTLISPTVSEETHASEYCMGDNGYVECDTTAKMDTYARVASVVSLSVQSNVVMDVIPKANGTVIETPVKLTVATNSAEGYSLYMKTMNDTNALVNLDTSTKSSIAPITGIVTTTELANQDNVWGYALSDQTTTEKLYQAVPLTQDKPIYATNSLVEGEDELDLSFGLNVTTSLPAGTYNNAVLVSAVANPVTITNLSELVFMQDMTSDICANTTLNPDDPITKQLIDSRDGKSYWVAKLRDGNCWMTQNLALDLSTEKTLMPSDTDITEPWTPPTSTEAEIPHPNTASNNDARSWSLGEILLTKPTNSTACPGQEVPDGYPNPDNLNSAFTGQSIAETCPGNYLDVKTTGLVPSSEPIATTTTSVIDNEYDAHYLIGNYYQFGAITAGSGIGLTGNNEGLANAADLVNAPNSICPKGWTLPKTGNQRNEGKGGPMFDIAESYYDLFNKYGYTPDKSWFYLNNGNTGVAMLNNPTLGEYDITGAPLYFVRAGNISADRGSLRVAGNTAHYLSSTVAAEEKANNIYNLFIDSSSFYMSAMDSRFLGSSARCLAR